MRVQVARRHEAGLGRVSVDPAEDEQVFFIAVVEERGLVYCFAGVGCGCLIGDHEPGDEEGVGHEGSAEDAACFEVGARVGGGVVEEGGAEGGGEEEGAER